MHVHRAGEGDGVVVPDLVEERLALTDANQAALRKAKAGVTVGCKVSYTVARGGAQRQITATMAEVPPEVLARWEKEYDRPVAVAQTDN